MSAFAVTAAATGAVAYLLLALAVAALYRRSPLGPAVMLAASLTSAWMGAQAYYYLEYELSGGILVLQVLELARNAGWVYVLARVLARSTDRQYAASVRALYWAFAVAAAIPAGAWLAAYLGVVPAALGIDVGKISLLGFLAQAVFGLALVEQVYRNTHPEARWSIKHLCFAVGGMLGLNWLDRRSGTMARETTGIDHAYLFGEWMYNKLDYGFGKDGMHIGTSSWVVGIALDL